MIMQTIAMPRAGRAGRVPPFEESNLRGKKIAIASSGLGHVSRGVEAWASDLGHALVRRGYRVSLCKGGGEAETPFERVIPCWQRGEARTTRLLRQLPRRFVWRLGLGSSYEIEQLTFSLGLLNYLRRKRIDLLHVQDAHVALRVQTAFRLGLVPTRTVLGHGTEEPFSFLKKVRYLQHLAPYYLEEARAAGYWSPTWTAIPNFIDTDVFRPGRAEALRAELGIPQDGFVVLTAAAIKRSHKRVDHLLEEFARLLQAHPALPVWLVVAGGWEEDTDELVALGRRTLGERVRFLVRFPRVRMPELYRMANVFALCSLREMMPIALLEATASGLPCLTHRHPILEWIPGPGGKALDMEKRGALAAEIKTLHADRDACQRLGRLGRQYCLDHFGRDRVVDQILDYYRFVLAN